MQVGALTVAIEQPIAETGKGRPLLDAHQAGALPIEATAQQQGHLPTGVGDAIAEVARLAHDDFGGLRRRRRAHVGDVVGDGRIGLVADGRDHRHRAGRNRAGHDFLVEGPEILDAIHHPGRR